MGPNRLRCPDPRNEGVSGVSGGVDPCESKREKSGRRVPENLDETPRSRNHGYLNESQMSPSSGNHP